MKGSLYSRDLRNALIEKGNSCTQSISEFSFLLFGFELDKRRDAVYVQSALVYEISWVFMVQDFFLLVGADVGVDLRGSEAIFDNSKRIISFLCTVN